MKTRIVSRMIAWMVLLALILPVFGSLPKVVDDAGLLTQQEILSLESKIAALEAEYAMDVVILTVPTLDGRTAKEYADSYYDTMGYAGDGILFLLAMNEREWYISTCGNAISLISDGEIDDLGEAALPGLKGGDYYDAFMSWLDALPQVLTAGGTEDPGSYSDTASYDDIASYDDSVPIEYYVHMALSSLIISLLIGAAVGAVVILIMRGAMNTKRKQSAASDYLDRDSYQLYVCQDLFLYSSVSRTRREPDPPSDFSGGDDGGGHGGGGGSF